MSPPIKMKYLFLYSKSEEQQAQNFMKIKLKQRYNFD